MFNKDIHKSARKCLLRQSRLNTKKNYIDLYKFQSLFITTKTKLYEQTSLEVSPV